MLPLITTVFELPSGYSSEVLTYIDGFAPTGWSLMQPVIIILSALIIFGFILRLLTKK